MNELDKGKIQNGEKHLLVRPKARVVGTVRPKARKSTCGRGSPCVRDGVLSPLKTIGRVTRVPQMAERSPTRSPGPRPAASQQETSPRAGPFLRPSIRAPAMGPSIWGTCQVT